MKMKIWDLFIKFMRTIKWEVFKDTAQKNMKRYKIEDLFLNFVENL